MGYDCALNMPVIGPLDAYPNTYNSFSCYQMSLVWHVSAQISQQFPLPWTRSNSSHSTPLESQPHAKDNSAQDRLAPTLAQVCSNSICPHSKMEWFDKQIMIILSNWEALNTTLTTPTTKSTGKPGNQNHGVSTISTIACSLCCPVETSLGSILLWMLIVSKLVNLSEAYSSSWCQDPCHQHLKALCTTTVGWQDSQIVASIGCELSTC